MKSRFYAYNFGVPLLCAALVFLLFDMTSIDIAISNLLFDPQTQTFPIDKIHFFESSPINGHGSFPTGPQKLP